MSKTNVLVVLVLALMWGSNPAKAKAEGKKPVAAAPAATKITKEEKKRYRAALKAGRAKLKKNDAKGAVKSFEAALVAIPDDARALSELGWAAFKAGDLVKARQATDRSIAAAGDPKLRAAAIYNLGRILEAEGKKDEALDAYKRSLALRPNTIVRDRIVAVDPNAKPDEPIAPEALDGPFESLEAYCAAYAKDDPDEPCVVAGDDGPPLPKLALEKPYKELALVLTGFEESCSLGIRTAAGWYVDEGFAECKLMGGRWDRFVSIPSVTLRDVVVGGAKEILVEVKTEESYNDTPPDAKDDEMVITTESYTTLLVCGVGASKQPACTPAVVTASLHNEGPEAALDVKFEDGALVLRLKQGAAATGDTWMGVLGKHPLRFP